MSLNIGSKVCNGVFLVDVNNGKVRKEEIKEITLGLSISDI
jgi:hypothetical protein